MRTLILLLGTILVLGLPANAQDTRQLSTHEQAAAELIELLRLREMTARSTAIMMESMLAQNPVLDQFRDIFIDFFADHMHWEDLFPEYLRMYVDTYEEAELRALSAFYRTPLGLKAIETMPRIMMQSAEIGQRQIEPFLAELQQRIERRILGGGGH